MNIWIFNQYAVRPEMAGSTRHFDCASRLVRKGHQVTIVSGTGKRKFAAGTFLPGGHHVRMQTVEGVRFLWIETPTYEANDLRRAVNMVQFAVRSLRAARRDLLANSMIAPPDVVVGSAVHLLAALAAEIIATRCKCPFVLELRDLWPQSLIEMGVLRRWHPLAIGLRHLEGWLLRRATRVIVLSERTAEYLVARGCPRERITLIPNGVDLERAGPVAPLPRSREEFLAVYLGAHGVANALDAVVDSAHILKERQATNVRIRLIGGGTEKERLRSRTLNLGLANVEFQPGVAKDRVPAALAAADVLLLSEANNVYGSSNKLNDYLAAGRPIIFSTFASHNIAPDCGIQVAPGDAEAIADAIITLSKTSAATREEMGARARQFAEEYRSWDILAERYASVLRAACDERGAAAN